MKTHAFPWTQPEIEKHTRRSVAAYWKSRSGQASKQKLAGKVSDSGSRSQVTGGQHLNAFIDLFCELIRSAGFTRDELRFKSRVELPGYFRAMKRWDVVVIRKNRLCAAIELKSQVGSFGNNFNNRTEEAIGNSVDIWRAFKAGLIGAHAPWVGYFHFLEDAAGSTRIVSAGSSEFKTDPIFDDTSYADRYRILCQRLVLERHYSAAALILAPNAARGSYKELSKDLGIAPFMKAPHGHLIGCT